MISVSHSVTHPTQGETDIEIIYEVCSIRKTIFKDKINAIAMENQCGRYASEVIIVIDVILVKVDYYDWE